MPIAHSSNVSYDQITLWFDEAISHLKGDKFLMENNIAHPETAEMYKQVISGDVAGMVDKLRIATSSYYLRNILIDFVDVLLSYNQLPVSISFSFSDSKVLIWALIKTDNEAAEDALIMAEAKINAKYYDKGFNVSVTIVEESDALKTPSHYIDIPIKSLADKRGKL